MIRPSFTLGGTGGGIAYGATKSSRIAPNAASIAADHQVLIEESVLGWKN